MSIVPYNSSNEIVYHDPNHGILVLHDNQDNTLQLLSTLNEGQNSKLNLIQNNDRNGARYDSKPHNNIKCPNCGFNWTEHSNMNDASNMRPNDTQGEFREALKVDPSNAKAIMKNFPEGFMHHDYFKLLGKLPYNSGSKTRTPKSLPENIFNQGYFKRFFKKVPPFTLGSGAHSQVYKVVHVLNDIKLGTYAVKRISIGDKIELLEQVLNEVLILYELSIKGANENNLIRYNHVWLELGDIQDLKTYFLPNSQKQTEYDNEIPYVFILQQYCDGGHLEDLINKTFLRELHLSMKEQVDLERQRRRSIRKHSNQNPERMEPENKKEKMSWLSDFEIWKFFRDVAKGVHYLHLHGILHRDLKPSNCLLDVKYESKMISNDICANLDDFNKKLLELPKILVSDFGEGQFIDKHNIPEQDLSIKELQKDSDERRGNTGTLEFTAPELWLFSNYDPSLGSERQYFINEFTYESDIYSLGLILCWLCAGTLPFSQTINGETDPQVIRDKIIKWYFDLNAASFHTWFCSTMHIEIASDDFDNTSASDFEKLIYLMIKGDDATLLEDSRPNRILSSDVIKFLDAMKWKRFISPSDVSQEEKHKEEGTNYDLIPANFHSEQEEAYDPDFIYNSDDLTSDDDETHNFSSSEFENDKPKYSSSIEANKISYALGGFDSCVIFGYLMNILLLDIFEFPSSYAAKITIKILVLLLFAVELLFAESKFTRISLLLSAYIISLAVGISID